MDARQIPARWRDVGFDDSGWQQAPLLPAVHPASFGETRPPTYPFGRLLPRGISQLGGDRVGTGSRTQLIDSEGPDLDK